MMEGSETRNPKARNPKEIRNPSRPQRVSGLNSAITRSWRNRKPHRTVTAWFTPHIGGKDRNAICRRAAEVAAFCQQLFLFFSIFC
jgi:hypothetical protein